MAFVITGKTFRTWQDNPEGGGKIYQQIEYRFSNGTTTKILYNDLSDGEIGVMDGDIMADKDADMLAAANT